MRRLAPVFALACLITAAGPVWADPVVLTIQPPGGVPAVTLTRADILALPQETFSTHDPWDKKVRQYKGPSLMTVLSHIGHAAGVSIVEVVAKNDYRAKFTLDEMERHQPILSHAMDGKDYSELGEENKGPLAIAIRMENVGTADKMRAKDQLVWWVERLVVK